MSTDRELLVMAAKAAGREIFSEGGRWFRRIPEPPPSGWNMIADWNPLTDDGDALRLAAKLYLWEAIRLAHRLVGSPGCTDIYAATRLSIVRAAADIGRAMP